MNVARLAISSALQKDTTNRAEDWTNVTIFKVSYEFRRRPFNGTTEEIVGLPFCRIFETNAT